MNRSSIPQQVNPRNMPTQQKKKPVKRPAPKPTPYSR